MAASCSAQAAAAAAAGHGPECDHCIQRGEELSLFRVIDSARVRALNESRSGSAAGCFRPFAERFDIPDKVLVSDVDEQLIIYVPFTASVKLKSITVMGGGGSESPSHLKLWADNATIDFTNCDRVAPTQELDLNDDVTGELDFPLRVAKFNGIGAVTLMFDRNFGAELTRVLYIGLKGEVSGALPIARAVVATYEVQPQRATRLAAEDALGARTGF